MDEPEYEEVRLATSGFSAQARKKFSSKKSDSSMAQEENSEEEDARN